MVETSLTRLAEGPTALLVGELEFQLGSHLRKKIEAISWKGEFSRCMGCLHAMRVVKAIYNWSLERGLSS